MMSRFFLTDDFLLQGEMARRLYHGHIKDLPIIDYHCHLPPGEIAGDNRYENLTEIWLKGDHYKWRAMRTMGIQENLITGDASDEAKFHAWARIVPMTIRNPLFHWTHMELNRVFGINEYLNGETAAGIYDSCNALLSLPGYSTQGILESFRVEFIGTTDEPWDNLGHHRQLAKEQNTFRVSPTFRPDKIVMIDKRDDFFQSLASLEQSCGISISDMASLLQALETRIEFFHASGCRASDHGLTQMPGIVDFSNNLETEFTTFIGNRKGTFSNPEAFMGYVMLELCRMYHRKGWVQQFHLGPIRDNNTRLNKMLGANSGFDSIGDFPQAIQMAAFFDRLDQTDQLAKSVIYNINPADNEVFASMLGNFNDGSSKGKMQFGSGWWFLDQKDGMEKQLNAVSHLGLVSTFIGMVTDSRSFLSFPRHEYFRRILCNLFGEEMEKGILPNDEKWIASILKDIAYHNAKTYFGL